MSFFHQVGKNSTLSLPYSNFLVKIVAVHKGEAVQKIPDS
jgi:hypothetical protein